VTVTGGEWRRYWSLPLAAALGYATSVIHIYGLGPYIEPISSEFGWSRTQLTVGLTISTTISGLLAVPVGLLVDRVGPRPLGLIGVVLLSAAFALLGTATGSAANWYLLWFVLAFATLLVQATIWTSAVASRFAASRGLALAVTLCGASVAQVVFPVLGTTLIDSFGWRQAMVVQGAIWVAVVFPLVFLAFRGAHEERRANDQPAAVPPDTGGTSFAQALRSTVYLRLFLAAILFTFTIVALSVHFVPMMTGRGLAKLEAAGLATLIGVASVVGRLGTGLLLDRFRGSHVGAAVFLLPVIGCAALLVSQGGGAAALAAIFIGLTLGAEVDVIVYLCTRYFGLKSFGALYGGLLLALSLGTATGPLAAAKLFDVYGSYDAFLWLTITFMLASSLCLVSLPRPPAQT
jgi:MFS family permease